MILIWLKCTRLKKKALKRAVRRNIKRIAADFMFQLTGEELKTISRTQFATLNKSRGFNIKYAPFAFTESGVAMLSSVLNSKTAIEINRGIMRTFATIRQLIANQHLVPVTEIYLEIKDLKDYMEDVLSDYNDINEDTRMQIELINQSLAELQTSHKIRNDKPLKRIGFITEE